MKAKPLKSRAIRRIIEKEKTVIESWYSRICSQFYEYLFADYIKLTYQQILDRFCRKWKAVCKYAIPRLKYLVPDPDSFYNEFQPLV